MNRWAVVCFMLRMSAAYALLAVQALWDAERSLMQSVEALGEMQRAVDDINERFAEVLPWNR